MKQQPYKPYLMALGLTFGLALMPAGAASAQTIVTNESANGSVELSNIPATDNQPPVAADATAEAAATTTPAAESSTAEAPKDPREQYRDNMMKEPEGQPTYATTAASRRYKMVDKAAYQANMLEPASQAAPAPQGTSSPAQ